MPGRRKRLLVRLGIFVAVLGAGGWLVASNWGAIQVRRAFTAYAEKPGEDTLSRLRERGAAAIEFLSARTGPGETEARRLAALGALEALAPEKTGDIVAAWKTDAVAGMRRAAIERIAKGSGPDRIGDLKGAAQDSDAGVRLAAAKGLAAIGGERVAPALLPFLTDANEAVRKVAVEGIAAAGKGVVEMLNAQLMAAKDEFTKRQIGLVLDRLGVPAGERTGLRGEEAALIADVERLKAARDVPNLRGLLRTGKPYAKRLAAAALGFLVAEEARGDLAVALGEEDTALRIAILEALGRMPDATLAPALVPRLKDKEPIVRRSAVKILSDAKAASAAAAVRPLIFDSDPRVRVTAIRAAGVFRDEFAIPSLAKALADEDGEARRNAAISLAGIGPVAIPELVAALRGAAGLPLRNRIALALEMIDEKPRLDARKEAFNDVKLESILVATKAESVEEKAIPGVLSALRDARKAVRRDAATVLGQILDPRAEEPLAVALRDPDPMVRRISADDLRLLRRPASVPRLEKALRDTDRIVRRKVLRALEAQGERGARALVPDLLETDCLILDLAEEALVGMPWEAVEKPLAEAVASPDARMRRRVLGVLRRRGGEGALALIRTRESGPEEPEAQLRGDVREILGEIGNAVPDSADPLSDIAADDAPTRRRGAFGLLRFDPAPAKAALPEALKVRDPIVRACACFVSGRLGGDPAPVRPVLEDPHWLARSEAASALGRLEDAESIPALVRALGDPDAYVRRRAAAALAQFHPDRVVPVLSAAMRSGEPEAREWAWRALEAVLRRPFTFEPAKPASHREAWAKDAEDWYAKESARFEEPSP